MNIYVLYIKVESEKYNINFSAPSLYYTLEEAIEAGKTDLKTVYLDYYDEENILEEEYNKFYNDKDIYYTFEINVVSGNRKRFNTSNELMNYFNENIKNTSNDNLYDFLLSLVESDNRYYDYTGKLINSEPIPQILKLQRICGCVVDFSMESCNNEGYYRFEYTVKD